jgi:hypothetical protein
MLNNAVRSYHDHIANRRHEQASAALHIATVAPATIANTIAKLRLAADILEAEHSLGDIPGAEVARLIERCDVDLKAVVHRMEME